MESLATIYDRYKGADCLHGSDKGTIHSYIDVYEEVFAPYRLSARRVVEIGMMSGQSLRMWEEYFPQAEVYGVDLCDQPHGGLADLRPMVAEGTHRIAFFNAADHAEVDGHFGDKMFDVVIDDASHYVPDQLAIYRNFKTHLAPGGVHIIEDIENIDRDRHLFENIDSDKIVRIVDLRAAKNRFDDVLVVIR